MIKSINFNTRIHLNILPENFRLSCLRTPKFSILKKFNTLISISALICVLLAGGCEKFLDKPIEGQVSSWDVDYSDLTQMYMPVAGVYANCRSVLLIQWSDNCVDQFRSDHIVHGSSIIHWYMTNELERYEYDNNNFYTFQAWDRPYRIINRCETALAELDKFRGNATGADLTKNDQYKAEVRFFRALAYWRVARYFGDICYFDKNIASIDLRLSPRAEAYDWIINEIKDFRDDLPDGHPNTLDNAGAVTRWAADMLLAKAAADVQDYTTMQEAAGDIVNSGLFSLHPDYSEMLSINGELCDENIFELQYYYYSADGTYTNIGSYYSCLGIRASITAKVPVLGNYSMEDGWGFALPSQTFIDLFISRGETVRYTRTIIAPESVTPKGDSVGGLDNNTISAIDLYTAENLPNGVAPLHIFKTFMESEDRTAVNNSEHGIYGGYNNIRVFRYADALLLYAEALVHNNGAGAGDAYINEVRARAGMTPLTGATIDHILDERAVELAMEWGGDRFYDLVRLGRTRFLGANFTAGEDEFLLTPQPQIDNHPGLTEDPVSGLFPTTFGD